MVKINYKLFIFYLALIFLLSPALTMIPDIGTEEENNTNSIPELFEEVTPDYMNEVLGNISSALNGYVFYDILANPPYPYNDSKVDLATIFEGIETDVNRPFYEFYRDFKKALAIVGDANFEILGGDIPLNTSSNETIHFGDYHVCLPFQLYIDYNDSQEAKIFIKEYPDCSEYYNDSVKTFIQEHLNISL